MIFTLEALRARHGDCLLLHYGAADDPRLILIDGGAARVWEDRLRARLDALREERVGAGDEPLPIDLVMVSHIDDDHINGVLDLTDDLAEAKEARRPQPFNIRSLWHNSFDDVLGNHPEELLRPGTAAVGGAATAEGVPAAILRAHQSALVLASVSQGRKLRDNARKLRLRVNAPGGTDGLILAAEDPVEFGDDLALRVLAPSRRRLLALQEEWDRFLEAKGLGRVSPVEAAAFSDESVFNLASIVVLAEAGGKTMLLTGDARGDDIREGLRAAGLWREGETFHVDLLKLPHHGSDRNVDTDFFRDVTADHYVVSGDGRHGNPEVATFEMLLTARAAGRPFTIHMTYPPAELPDVEPDYDLAALEAAFAGARAAGKRFEVATTAGGADGLFVHLGEEL